MNVQFKKQGCRIEQTHYPHNNQPALLLYDGDTDQVVAKATVCLDYEFEPGQTAIKDWSENEGILKALIEVGCVKDTGLRVPTGYCEAAIVDIVQD